MKNFKEIASEHMVMTIKGREFEKDTYRRLLTKFPKNILSLVSDQYDIYEVCKFLATDPELKELILNRDGKLVIRPDSGEPREVLENCLDILAEGFGFTTNSKGYKVLNSKIGLLQGDGITIYTMNSILNYLATKGWSIDNFVFGSGGGLLQKYDRDTMQFAIKCCYAIIDGIPVNVYKDPVTSKGSKTSKRGVLYTTWDPANGYQTINETVWMQERKNNGEKLNMLQTVFDTGVAYNEQTYEQIQETMKIDMKRFDDVYTIQTINKELQLEKERAAQTT